MTTMMKMLNLTNLKRLAQTDQTFFRPTLFSMPIVCKSVSSNSTQGRT